MKKLQSKIIYDYESIIICNQFNNFYRIIDSIKNDNEFSKLRKIYNIIENYYTANLKFISNSAVDRRYKNTRTQLRNLKKLIVHAKLKDQK